MSHAQIRCPQCQGLNRVRPDKLGQAVCGRCKNKLTPSAPLDLDDAGFDALVRHAEVPVLLDLWSPTCGPCRMVAPDVARLAEEQAGLRVARSGEGGDCGQRGSVVVGEPGVYCGL